MQPSPPAEVSEAEYYPYGSSIPSKRGFCYSPYDKSAGIVDVQGMATGTKVRCPYTGKVFLVPPGNGGAAPAQIVQKAPQTVYVAAPYQQQQQQPTQIFIQQPPRGYMGMPVYQPINGAVQPVDVGGAFMRGYRQARGY